MMKQLKITALLLLFGISSGFTQTDCSVWGPDSIQAVQSISLYREFYKQQNYEDAYIHWQYVFHYAPGARQNTYIDGVEIYKKLIEKEADAAKKEKLIDTLFMIYDQRIRCFGEAGSVLGRKGLDMIRYRPNQIKEILDNYKKAVASSGNNTDYFILAPYFSVAAQAYKNNQVTKEEIFATYQQLSAIIASNLESKYADKYKEAQGILADIFAQSDVVTNCEDAKAVFQKQYQEAPDNVELWKKIVELLKSAGCEEDPLYIEVLEKLYQKEPSPESAYFLGKVKFNQNKVTEAISFFNMAIDADTADTKKASYYFALANAYRLKDDFPSARTHAKKAASLRANWGEPYLFIGDLYASSGKKCGPGTGYESQVVTWVAIDMYQKAKAVDPSVSEQASEKIASYSKYMPSNDDVFFRGLKEGDTFKVECWINEATTVRARKE